VGDKPASSRGFFLYKSGRRGGYIFILFVSLLAGLRKIYSISFHKNSVEMWHMGRTQKKSLDLRGNPDRVTLG